MSLTVDPKKMLELESLIFQKSGLKKEEADTVADNLVQAEMRGIHSHGLIQTENYSKLMRAKKNKSSFANKNCSRRTGNHSF